MARKSLVAREKKRAKMVAKYADLRKKLKEEGKEVVLYTYFERTRNSMFSRYNELLSVCSKWVKLTAGDFE